MQVTCASSSHPTETVGGFIFFLLFFCQGATGMSGQQRSTVQTKSKLTQFKQC